MGRHKGVFAAIMALSISSFGLAAPIRTWTDDRGQTIKASFVRVYGENVVLMQGRKVLSVPFVKLSEEDREYVRKQVKTSGQRSALPSEKEIAKRSQQTAEGPESGMPRMPGPSREAAPNMPTLPRGTPSAPSNTMPPRFSGSPPSMPPGSGSGSPNPYPGSSGPVGSGPGSSTAYPGASGPVGSGSGSPPASSPSMPNRPMPSIPGMSGPSIPEMVQTKVCGKCGKPVPSNLTAGDKCPHCGVFFTFDETTGKRSSIRGGAIFGGLVGGSIGFVVWLIRALSRRR